MSNIQEPGIPNLTETVAAVGQGLEETFWTKLTMDPEAKVADEKMNAGWTEAMACLDKLRELIADADAQQPFCCNAAVMRLMELNIALASINDGMDTIEITAAKVAEEVNEDAIEIV